MLTKVIPKDDEPATDRIRRMNIDQINKQRMGQATLETIHRHQPQWSGIAGFAEAVAILDEVAESIQDRAREQTARTGHAAAKQEAFHNMVQSGFLVCSGLKALASATGNTQLFAQVDFSRSDLARGREADVVNRCRSVLDLGRDNAGTLAARFNIPAADLDALEAAIEAFATAQPKPRQGKAAAASATRDLAALFTRLDDVLAKRIDPLMEKFLTTDAAFYNEYQTARSIVDATATRERKPEVVSSQAQPMSLPKAA